MQNRDINLYCINIKILIVYCIIFFNLNLIQKLIILNL